jgi:hypothetical protein
MYFFSGEGAVDRETFAARVAFPKKDRLAIVPANDAGFGHK